MNRSDKAAAFLLVLLLGSFAAGLWALLVLRFETGDVNPAYSSLRPDPLGVKALFQALEQMPDVTVERHYRPLTKLAGSGKMTLFYLGLEPGFLTVSRPDVDRLETLAGDGARLVIAFRSGLKKPLTPIVPAPSAKEQIDPEGNSPKPETEPPKEGSQAKEERGKPKEEATAKDEAKRPAGERWGVKADYLSMPAKGEHNRLFAFLTDKGDAPPDSFPLHTALCFKDLGPEWRALYSAGGCPVIIERALGAGSIVLVADSYIFSNEAIFKERRPGLLARLTGDCRLAVFDEFHLGVSERPGMMTLLRKYRLHGFFASLVLLAGLFAWQNLVRFIPENTDGETKEPTVAPGTDQLEGLVNLLQRNIKSDVLLKTCFQEWENSVGRDSTGMEEKIRQARDLVENQKGKGTHKDPTAVYGEVARILSDRTYK